MIICARTNSSHTNRSKESLYDDLLGGAHGGARIGRYVGGKGGSRWRQAFLNYCSSFGDQSSALVRQASRSSLVRLGFSFAQAASPPEGCAPTEEAVVDRD